MQPESVFNKNEKIKVYIYLERDGKIFAITKTFAFKTFPLYQKVSPFKHASSNQLKITGGFKYFELTAVISSFFVGLSNLSSNVNFFICRRMKYITSQSLLRTKLKYHMLIRCLLFNQRVRSLQSLLGNPLCSFQDKKILV